MVLVWDKENKSIFVEYIKKRIKENKNFIVTITGPTGSGKSFAAMRLGEMIDPRFNINNIVFTPKQFMKLVNGGTLQKGSVIIFDEAGVSLSHRDWQSLSNKLINFVLQTFRHKNFVLVFTTPHASFVDASTRRLFHSTIETVSINQNEKYCRLKPLLIQVNQRSGDLYFKYLRVIAKGGGVAPLKAIKVGLPAPSLIRQYENKKNEFTRELNEDIEQDIIRIVYEKKKSNDDKKPLTKKQEECVILLQQGKRMDEIAPILGITLDGIYKHVRSIKNKGYSIEPIRNGDKIEKYLVH